MWLNSLTRLASPAHARWLETEFDALIGFAADAGTEHGFGYLDAAGDVLAGKGHDLYLTCRMVHVFALAHLLGRPGAASQVDHGLAALTGAFHDSTHGGWYTALDDEGAIRDPRKDAYAHAFVVLAAASAKAAGRLGADDLLTNALAVIEEEFWDDAAGMVVESYDREFAHAEDYRGLNSNMHMVEAFVAAADATGNDEWLQRALRITERAMSFAREHDWRLPEHFTSAWEPVLDYHADNPAHPFRPAGSTIGHWFEWARLALHVEAALEPQAPEFFLEAAQELFRQGVEDGWSVDGADGFVYTVDVDGRPLVRERMHWVVAEAIGSAAALYQRTGEVTYERWYRLWWEYAAVHLIDREGSWIHELTPAGSPSEGTWVGKPDIYHAAQATLIPRIGLAPALAESLARGRLDQAVRSSNEPQRRGS